MKYFSLLIILLASCEPNQTKEISIHTNDVHSSVRTISPAEYTGNFKNYKGIDTLTTYPIDRYVLDLDSDMKQDTIILENLKDLKGEPQLFTIVRIKLANQKEYVLKDVQGRLIDKTSKLGLANRISSDKMYIPATKSGENLIFVWDYQYPDCSAKLAIYQFNRSDVSERFKEDFYVSEITEQDKSGVIGIVGKPLCQQWLESSESLKAEIEDYNPYQVFQLLNTVVLDTAATRMYNLKNYVFAGSEDKPDTKVVVPWNKQKPYWYKK